VLFAIILESTANCIQASRHRNALLLALFFSLDKVPLFFLGSFIFYSVANLPLEPPNPPYKRKRPSLSSLFFRGAFGELVSWCTIISLFIVLINLFLH
jgi:hypothetical protein